MQLWDLFITSENFLRAWDQVRINNGVPGIDGISCLSFGDRVATIIPKLIEDLAKGVYQPAPLKPIVLNLPDNRTRTLLIPSVRDRVAQTAMHFTLLPRLETELADCTFAYRPGLSHHDAVQTVGMWRHQGYEWVVDADITQYFDEVPHDLLLDRLRILVPEKRVLSLVHQWISAPIGKKTQSPKRSKGLPQGSPISPLLSNLFLDQLDEALLAENLKLVRFADDFVILCKNQHQALSALALTVSVLDDLRLSLHPQKTRIAHFDEGFQFLGHLFLRSLILPLKSKQRIELSSSTPIDHLIRASESIVTFEPRPSLLPEVKTKEETPWPLPFSVAIGASPDTTLADALTNALAEKGVSLTHFKDSLIETAPPIEELFGAQEDDAIEASPSSEQHPSTFAPPSTPSRGFEPSPSTEQQHHPAFGPLILKDTPLAKGMHLLRTLYLHEQGAWLQVEGDRFRVTKTYEQTRSTLLDIAVMKVEQIIVFGSITITPAAIRKCLTKNISITYLSVTGKFYGHLVPPHLPLLDRIRAQFRLSEDETQSLRVARAFILGKLTNQRMYLQRLAQEHTEAPLHEAIQYLGKRIRRIPGMKTTEMLRGLEGLAASHFYTAWATCIRQEGFAFTHRQRRPPPDPVNALLSFGYTLLYQNMMSILYIHRLDPYLGILHAERSGHAALASDLMEEFRFLIDRMVLRIINKKILLPTDFFRSEDEHGQVATYLKPEARKKFIRTFEDLMNTKIHHARLNRSVTYRQAMDVQVQYLIRVLQKEEPYLAFRFPK